MKKTTKRGFTIVELVIVIAVIAILASILIPTFSNIIKKANLSADKQAVREMNMALAADEAANGYGKNMNVDDAMLVLADAGYNADNWVCFADGYQVYWYDEDNRMILYNSSTAEIEYPEEYIGAKTKDGVKSIMLSSHVHIYNENHIKAQQFNMSLSNSAKADSTGKITGTTTYTGNNTLSSVTTKGGEVISSGNSTNNLTYLSSPAVKSTISKALTGNTSSSVYMYATKEDVSANTSGAYASLQICSVGTEETLVNNGEIKENLYYICIVENNGTKEEISSAQKAAAQYVYNVFDQITEGKIEDNVTVLIKAGTTIDCSLGGADWAPCKTFTGYFGCPDGTITIDGANLTAKTGYAQTVNFTGSEVKDPITGVKGNSKYFVTGFFGTIYGDTTIENVTFKNINIDQPATDFELNNKDTSRNTVAIIGGITDGFTNLTNQHKTANIVIKNVTVDSSCNITGIAGAGGLVGYIGSGDGSAKDGNADHPYLSGTITFENCNVAPTVTSLKEYENKNDAYYGVGGLISFTCRCSSSLNITIKDVTCSSKLTGNHYVGGCFADIMGGTITFAGTNDFSGVTFNNGLCHAGISGRLASGSPKMNFTGSTTYYKDGTYKDSAIPVIANEQTTGYTDTPTKK